MDIKELKSRFEESNLAANGGMMHDSNENECVKIAIEYASDILRNNKQNAISFLIWAVKKLCRDYESFPLNHIPYGDYTVFFEGEEISLDDLYIIYEKENNNEKESIIL